MQYVSLASRQPPYLIHDLVLTGKTTIVIIQVGIKNETERLAFYDARQARTLRFCTVVIRVLSFGSMPDPPRNSCPSTYAPASHYLATGMQRAGKALVNT